MAENPTVNISIYSDWGLARKRPGWWERRSDRALRFTELRGKGEVLKTILKAVNE